MVGKTRKELVNGSTQKEYQFFHYSEADHLYRNIIHFADTILFEYTYQDGQLYLSTNAKGQLNLSAFKDFFDTYKDNAPQFGEVLSIETCLGKTGEPYHWCSCKLSTKWEEGTNTPVSLIGKLQDITSLKKREEQLLFQCLKDGLTGVYNKTAFELRVEEKLKGGRVGWLCMIDIDNFKVINDSFGHPAGDRMLEQVGRMLCHIFPEPDLVGRVGGDEFVVFTSTEDVGERAKSLLDMVESIVPEEEGRISASIGIVSSSGKKKENYQELFFRADRAMYRAKESGKNQIAFYHNSWATIL